MPTKVFSAQELFFALNSGAKEIEIQTSILSPSSVILPPGVKLSGVDKHKSILSFNNGDGIGLTANNEVSTLTVIAPHSQRAIYALSDRASLGVLKLENLQVTGQVQILTRMGTKSAQIYAENVDVVSCDARKYSEQPQKYGVNVYQGAFTIYNFNGDQDSIIHATLKDISVGRKGAPVLGSGVFIGGYGENNGSVEVDILTTGEVHSTGMIPYGTADMITAGVFISVGAFVRKATHKGEVVTYGVNDMVLDTWGKVDHWIAEKPLLSYGPSGIGFVNFGIVNTFEAHDKIETYGPGARGFNQYDGTIDRAKFSSIATYGNGSIGIQISKPVGSIEVDGSVTTYGASGATLVKGVIMNLPANALSIKSGGDIQNLNIKGSLSTFGKEVTSLEIEGRVAELSIDQGISANGTDSIGVTYYDNASAPLEGIQITSTNGIAARISKGAKFVNHSQLHAKGAKGDIIRF